MKRVLGLVVAGVLAVAGLAIPQTAVAATSSSGSVVTPDGKVVQKVPTTVPGRQPGRDAGVYKGMPKTGGVTALTSCDGVGSTACYLYNTGSQGSVSKNGVIALARIGGATGALDPTQGYHTLGEIAVESADQKQIVELGWTVDPSLNKTAGVGVYTPRPFVFSWVNGYPGVYNAGNFVLVSSATATPGVTDLTPGTTPQIGIYHDDTLHAWWFQWGGAWMGYYPDTQWTGASPTANFTRLEFVQLFGEIAASVAKPCSDMGTGYPPTDTTNGAKFSSTTYLNAGMVNDSASVNLFLREVPSTTATSPYAGVLGAGSPPSATNLRTFYYGGPMWNSAKTGVGTRGAC